MLPQRVAGGTQSWCVGVSESWLTSCNIHCDVEVLGGRREGEHGGREGHGNDGYNLSVTVRKGEERRGAVRRRSGNGWVGIRVTKQKGTSYENRRVQAGIECQCRNREMYMG